MALIATEDRRVSDWLKHEYEPSIGYCREGVIVREAVARTLKGGTVLGQVTSDGKYKIALQAAVDGSQNAAGLVYEDSVTIPANTDVRVLVLVRGPAQVLKTGLTLDASYGTAPQIAAAQAQLVARGIQMLETM
jgi:Bacteriophage lambda head decoration protein D